MLLLLIFFRVLVVPLFADGRRDIQISHDRVIDPLADSAGPFDVCLSDCSCVSEPFVRASFAAVSFELTSSGLLSKKCQAIVSLSSM